MKIRKATLKDLKEIDEIYIEGSIDEGKLQFPKVSEKEMLKKLKKHKKKRIKEFKKKMLSKKNHWLVMVEGNKIIGFGEARLKDYEDDKNYGEIEYVYVRKGFRNKGAGRKIDDELIKWLKKRKIKKVGARLYSSNKPSVKFHEKLGFKITALKMEKKIK